MALKRYPIGIQGFESLRNAGFYYVDKTQYIYQLATTSKVYFLSRPRRFGKSLLMSTLEAYFQGKRELFAGLAIEGLEKEWREFPVLHIDFNAKNYQDTDSLYNIIKRYLEKYESVYGNEKQNESIEERFVYIIEAAHKQTGLPVVILIDEYDKPLLATIDDEELQQQYRNILKAFYGVLKTMDNHIRFALLTGVSKFSHVSIFSDLNNLQDISMLDDYADICGITEQELRDNFQDDIEEMARRNDTSPEEMAAKLQEMYDGYHFSKNSPGIYNPFSLLNAFSAKELGSYWFATGTPTYLVQLMKQHDFDIRELEGTEAAADEIMNVESMSDNPVPVLYQSGYLTIKGYDPEFGIYTLGLPNKEVKRGLLNFLLPHYSGIKNESPTFAVASFVKDARNGRVDSFVNRLKSFLATIPNEQIVNYELHYENVIFILTSLAGLYVKTEYRTGTGRIDMVIQTDKYYYIIEFKLNGTAEEAIAQLNRKDYALPFAMDNRKIYKIGIQFSKETRNIDRWIVEE